MRCGVGREDPLPRPAPWATPAVLHHRAPATCSLGADPGLWTLGPSCPQISIPGNLGTAVLPVGRHSEYEITILAYYRDGARSDPVSLRYTPRT